MSESRFDHARDISDGLFLAALRRALELRPSSIGVTRWDLASVLGGLDDQVAALRSAVTSDDFNAVEYVYDVPGVPEKVVLAKAKRMIRRGLIDGCACGCRGDFLPVAAPVPAGVGDDQ